ncbi:hypothetical protein C3L33_09028, partial [Rhododendron williamsianum]
MFGFFPLCLQDALEPYMSQRTLEVHWGEHHRGYLEGLNKQLAKSDKLYGYTLDELVKARITMAIPYQNLTMLPRFVSFFFFFGLLLVGHFIAQNGLRIQVLVSLNLIHNLLFKRTLVDFLFQVWNHDFFWESMQPGGGNMPILGLLGQIEKDFGSFTNFKEKFIEAALTLFGSGWVWLVGKSCLRQLLLPMKRNEKRLEVVKTTNAFSPLVWNDIPLVCLDMWEHAYYLDYKCWDAWPVH